MTEKEIDQWIEEDDTSQLLPPDVLSSSNSSNMHIMKEYYCQEIKLATSWLKFRVKTSQEASTLIALKKYSPVSRTVFPFGVEIEDAIWEDYFRSLFLYNTERSKNMTNLLNSALAGEEVHPVRSQSDIMSVEQHLQDTIIQTPFKESGKAAVHGEYELETKKRKEPPSAFVSTSLSKKKDIKQVSPEKTPTRSEGDLIGESTRGLVVDLSEKEKESASCVSENDDKQPGFDPESVIKDRRFYDPAFENESRRLDREIHKYLKNSCGIQYAGNMEKLAELSDLELEKYNELFQIAQKEILDMYPKGFRLVRESRYPKNA